MNSDPPPFHTKVIPNKTDKVDRRNIGRMHVPGIFFLEYDVRAGRERAPRRATSPARGSTATASS